MSLVEVMVTMAVAMTMALGVMQAITFSNKAIKSSGLSSDWINLMQTARLAYSDPNQCKSNFTTLPLETTNPLPGSTAAADVTYPVAGPGTLPSLVLRDAGGAIVTTLISTSTVIGNLKANSIKVIVAPGNQTQTIKLGAITYLMDMLQLSLDVSKVKPDGTTLDGVGTTRMISHWKNNNAISFSILRDPTGAVTGCYGQANAAEQACNELGGLYYVSGDAGASTPKCRLPSLYFGSDTGYSASSANPTIGQRIQLAGSHGTQAPGDTSIGVSAANTAWFNAPSTVRLETNNQQRVTVANGGDFKVFQSGGAVLRLGVTNAGDFNTFNSAGTAQLSMTNAGDMTISNPMNRAVLLNQGAGNNGIRISGNYVGYYGPGQAEIANSTDPSYQTLMILGNVSGNGSADPGATSTGPWPSVGRRVSIWDRLDVNGYLFVAGSTKIMGNLTVGGTTTYGGAVNFSGDVTVGGQLDIGRYVNVVVSFASATTAVPDRGDSYRIVNCASPQCYWGEDVATCPVNTQMMGGFCGTGPPEYPVESMHNAFLVSLYHPVTDVRCYTVADHGHQFYMMAFCAKILPHPPND